MRGGATAVLFGVLKEPWTGGLGSIMYILALLVHIRAGKHVLPYMCRGVSREMAALQRTHERAARDLLPALEAHADNMGRQLRPVLER